jgi:preprotein translocase subunit SecD
MGAVRVLRTLAPLVLLATVLAGCGDGSSTQSSGGGDSTILGASSGFEVRVVYARYAPGVPFGPELPQDLVQEMENQSCPMQPRIVGGLLMECDTSKTVYLLKNPIVKGDIAAATPQQVGHRNIWYVEVSLKSDVAQTVSTEIKSMTGQQLAFSYKGAVLTSIAIDSSFHPDHFAITGNYDKDGATQLAQQLNG